MTEKSCGTCKYWVPRYFGVGMCNRQARMHAKFWVTDDKVDLLTVKGFSCSEHEQAPSPDPDTL